MQPSGGMIGTFLKRSQQAVLVAVLAGVAACGGADDPPPPSQPPPQTPADAGTPDADAGTDAGTPGPNLARGEAVFQTNCTVCHPGGDQGVGPSLKTSQATTEQIRTQVRNGAGGMPPFPSFVISDDELDDLIAYVLSLRTQ